MPTRHSETGTMGLLVAWFLIAIFSGVHAVCWAGSPSSVTAQGPPPSTDQDVDSETNTVEGSAPERPKVPVMSSLSLSRSYLQRRHLEGQYVFDRHIRIACRTHRVDYHLVKAIVRVESAFRSEAVSPKGAMGLMQLMPETAKNLKVPEPFDAFNNVDGGVRYFRKMLDLFKNDIVLALAAYNAGPQAVKTHKGVPPFEETKWFVQSVLELYSRYRVQGY